MSFISEELPNQITLELPWPPSVNHYKKVGGLIRTTNGRLYQQRTNTDATKKFYFDVYVKSKMVMGLEWVKSSRSTTIAYEIYVYLYPPNKRRYDLDNGLKVLLDGLVRAHVINDDSQITRLTVEKCPMIPQGQVTVIIREIL